jgi:hypothetical protein
MKKTVMKYVNCLSYTATSYQRKQHKRYDGNLAKVRRSVAFDISHGVTTAEVLDFLEKFGDDLESSDMGDKEERMERLHLIKINFAAPIPY